MAVPFLQAATSDPARSRHVVVVAVLLACGPSLRSGLPDACNVKSLQRQWHCIDGSSPLTVAGAAPALIRAYRTGFPLGSGPISSLENHDDCNLAAEAAFLSTAPGNHRSLPL